jgi:hypothetical protein
VHLFNSEGDVRAAEREQEAQLKNVTVYRIEAWDAADGFGHYWIEVNNGTSVEGWGWWPDPSANKSEWFNGTGGQLADGWDPHTGDRSGNVKVYDVYVVGVKEAARQNYGYVTNAMRNVAASYNNQYSMHSDCHSFQKGVAYKLGWRLRQK